MEKLHKQGADEEYLKRVTGIELAFSAGEARSDLSCSDVDHLIRTEYSRLMFLHS